MFGLTRYTAGMAHPDLNELYSVVVTFAQQLLQEHDELYPFGGTVDADGECSHFGLELEDEEPTVETMLEMLATVLSQQAKAGKARATAIVFDVNVTQSEDAEPTDAICVRLEHRSGEAIDVFCPYTRDAEGKYRFGEFFATPSTPTVFVIPES